MRNRSGWEGEGDGRFVKDAGCSIDVDPTCAEARNSILVQSPNSPSEDIASGAGEKTISQVECVISSG